MRLWGSRGLMVRSSALKPKGCRVAHAHIHGWSALGQAAHCSGLVCASWGKCRDQIPCMCEHWQTVCRTIVTQSDRKGGTSRSHHWQKNEVYLEWTISNRFKVWGGLSRVYMCYGQTLSGDVTNLQPLVLLALALAYGLAPLPFRQISSRHGLGRDDHQHWSNAGQVWYNA